MKMPDAIREHYTFPERDPINVANLMDLEERALVPTGVMHEGLEQALPIHYIPGNPDDVIVQSGGFGWTPGGREKNQDTAFRAGIVDMLQDGTGRPTIVSVGFVGVEQAPLREDYEPLGYFNRLTPEQRAGVMQSDFDSVGVAATTALTRFLDSKGHGRARLTMIAPSMSGSVAAGMLGHLLEHDRPVDMLLVDPVATEKKKFGRLLEGLTRSALTHPDYLALNGAAYQWHAKNTVATSTNAWLQHIVPEAQTHLAYVSGLGGNGIIDAFNADVVTRMGRQGGRVGLAVAGASEYRTLAGAEHLGEQIRATRMGRQVLDSLTIIAGASHAVTSTQRVATDGYQRFRA